MPQSRKTSILACFAGLFAFSCCSLSILPSFASCPLSHYNVIQGNGPGFSSCTLNHYNVVSDNGSGIWPYRRYVSSNARPPQLQINRTDRALSPGLIFITPAEFDPVSGAELPVALIMTDDGDLVWSSGTAATGEIISNFRCQVLQNKSVITYWNGTRAGTHGYGAVEIFDDKYEKINSVCPKLNGNILSPPNTECLCDQHEALITPDNKMVVTVYNNTAADLESIGGPNDAFVVDSLAVEVDIETNEALFVWSPLRHISILQSRFSLGQTGKNASNPWDWFHINAINSWGDGFLINSRHTWSIYYVSRNGDIQWRIEGVTGGDFGPLPEGGHFVCLQVRGIHRE